MRRRFAKRFTAAVRNDGGGHEHCAAPRTPWWQGAWQALGGLFNLLAALAGRWPKHGA